MVTYAAEHVKFKKSDEPVKSHPWLTDRFIIDGRLNLSAKFLSISNTLNRLSGAAAFLSFTSI